MPLTYRDGGMQPQGLRLLAAFDSRLGPSKLTSSLRPSTAIAVIDVRADEQTIPPPAIDGHRRQPPSSAVQPGFHQRPSPAIDVQVTSYRNYRRPPAGHRRPPAGH